MKIEYIKNVTEKYGYNYKIKKVELCCQDMMDSLKTNEINVESYNPYKAYEKFKFGIAKKNKINYSTQVKSIKVCPYCGKEIILNQIEECYDNEEEDRINDQFFCYSFDKIEEAYNWIWEK
jgi:hypothetical protein